MTTQLGHGRLGGRAAAGMWQNGIPGQASMQRDQRSLLVFTTFRNQIRGSGYRVLGPGARGQIWLPGVCCSCYRPQGHTAGLAVQRSLQTGARSYQYSSNSSLMDVESSLEACLRHRLLCKRCPVRGTAGRVSSMHILKWPRAYTEPCWQSCATVTLKS